MVRKMMTAAPKFEIIDLCFQLCAFYFFSHVTLGVLPVNKTIVGQEYFLLQCFLHTLSSAAGFIIFKGQT